MIWSTTWQKRDNRMWIFLTSNGSFGISLWSLIPLNVLILFRHYYYYTDVLRWSSLTKLRVFGCILSSLIARIKPRCNSTPLKSHPSKITLGFKKKIYEFSLKFSSILLRIARAVISSIDKFNSSIGGICILLLQEFLRDMRQNLFINSKHEDSTFPSSKQKRKGVR